MEENKLGAPTEFVDVNMLTSSERLKILTDMRHQQSLAKEGKSQGLTDEQLAYAIQLIRIERAGNAAASGRKASAPTPTDLSAF